MFTSLKDGDLDIYTMNVDGIEPEATHDDAGLRRRPVLVARRQEDRLSRLASDRHARSTTYRDLLGQRLVRPNRMELWVMNADGSDQRQITNLGGANFAPFFTPDGKRIIFSSNHTNPRSRNFDLYLVNLDGTGLEQVTDDARLRRLPDVRPDGKKLVWASNRGNAPDSHSTNLFLADVEVSVSVRGRTWIGGGLFTLAGLMLLGFCGRARASTSPSTVRSPAGRRGPSRGGRRRCPSRH